MISIFIAVISCTFSNLIIQYAAGRYTYNVSSVLLATECFKSLICLACMRYIANPQPFRIRWGFAVNAVLYGIVNVLTHRITAIVPVAMYSVLVQLKLIWIVLFSSWLLGKTYNMKQFVALALVCTGCMMVKMTDTLIIVSNMGILLILIQGVCSSLSSVWIEKMMKSNRRPSVSEDPNRQKLFWFFSDSLQMYIFGIPLYIFGLYTSHTPENNIPGRVFISIVVVSIVQGLSLGAIFVYYSSVVRSMVAAIVIVILALHRGVFSLPVFTGVATVIAGVIGWTFASAKK